MLNEESKSLKTSDPVSSIQKEKNRGDVRYIYRKSAVTLNAIKSAYIELVKENQGSVPTVKDIADKVKLSTKQVERHMKNIDWSSEMNQLFKIFIPEVTHALLVKARKGDTAAAKLFFQFVADWKEKSDFDIKSNGEAFPTPQIIIKARGEEE